MKNVLIVAPLESNGRYKGGIMSVANALIDNSDEFSDRNIRLIEFNTYIRKRKAETIGKIDLDNILNMFDIIFGILKKTKEEKIATIYYNTSIKMALLKDIIVGFVVKKARKDIKLIYHIHFAEYRKIMPNNAVMQKFILHVLKKHADSIIFLSKKTCSEFVDKGLDKNKCFVIYNFTSDRITSEQFVAKKTSYIKKPFLELLYMASIDKRKGVLDLLEVLRRCQIPYKLHLCGICNDDEIKQEYQKKLETIKDNVEVHGHVEHELKREILQKSDCMVLPSYGEGFPLVVIEQMAFGGTVIATPVGAVPEFFRDKINGRLFNPGDLDALKCFIEEAYKNKEDTIKQMELNFEESKNYTVDRFIDALSNLI